MLKGLGLGLEGSSLGLSFVLMVKVLALTLRFRRWLRHWHNLTISSVILFVLNNYNKWNLPPVADTEGAMPPPPPNSWEKNFIL